jgi:hypothetical protein
VAVDSGPVLQAALVAVDSGAVLQVALVAVESRVDCGLWTAQAVYDLLPTALQRTSEPWAQTHTSISGLALETSNRRPGGC